MTEAKATGPANVAGLKIVEYANVLDFPGPTRLDYPANHALARAVNANLQSAIVIGYDANGGEFFVSSIADGADVNWLLDRIKLRLLSMEGQ